MKLFLELSAPGEEISFAALQSLFERTAKAISENGVRHLKLADSPGAPRVVLLSARALDEGTEQIIEAKLVNKVEEAKA